MVTKKNPKLSGARSFTNSLNTPHVWVANPYPQDSATVDGPLLVHLREPIEEVVGGIGRDVLVQPEVFLARGYEWALPTTSTCFHPAPRPRTADPERMAPRGQMQGNVYDSFTE